MWEDSMADCKSWTSDSPQLPLQLLHPPLTPNTNLASCNSSFPSPFLPPSCTSSVSPDTPHTCTLQCLLFPFLIHQAKSLVIRQLMLACNTPALNTKCQWSQGKFGLPSIPAVPPLSIRTDMSLPPPGGLLHCPHHYECVCHVSHGAYFSLQILQNHHAFGPFITPSLHAMLMNKPPTSHLYSTVPCTTSHDRCFSSSTQQGLFKPVLGLLPFQLHLTVRNSVETLLGVPAFSICQAFSFSGL